jgi:hypothetical protein
MKTPAFTAKLLAALFVGSALFTALPAEAHDRGGWRDRHFDRYDHRGWDDHRGRSHRRGHFKERWDRHDRVIIREKVIVRRPAVREYRYYERPGRVYSPYYSPYYRDPAIVIGVDVPPIVIPLR